jgi:uncharacterized membrane protein affecting hemolysin expression
MSVRQAAREGAGIAGWWIFFIILGVIAVLAITLTWAGIAPWATNKQREINHNSQQYQDSLIVQERNAVTAINTANSDEQKQFFTDQFCAQYVDIIQPPSDLMIAHGKLC